MATAEKSTAPTQVVASFAIQPEGRRSADEPSDTAVRIAWLLVALLRHAQVDATSFVRAFQMSEWTFKRDVRRLRQIGEQCGFTLGPLKNGVVRLAARDARLKPLLEESERLLDLVRVIAKAFGAPVLSALAPSLGPERPESKTFLRVSAPRLVEDTEVGRLFAELRGAHDAHARVRFQYLGRDDAASDREAEPYGVVWNAGRFYLIAYDVAPRRAWRQFALDRIRGTIRRSGTFAARAIPAQYAADDAVGLFKTRRTIDVTIELSPAVAAAVTCRLWQAAQRVTGLPGARAQITLSVGDVNEAVRWAMSFGADASVVNPPEAIQTASAIAEELAARYAARIVESTTISRSA